MAACCNSSHQFHERHRPKSTARRQHMVNGGGRSVPTRRTDAVFARGERRPPEHCRRRDRRRRRSRGAVRHRAVAARSVMATERPRSQASPRAHAQDRNRDLKDAGFRALGPWTSPPRWLILRCSDLALV